MDKAAMWIKIKNEYLTGQKTLKELASEYKMSYAALRNKVSLEKWNAEKKGITKTVFEKCAEIKIQTEVDNFKKINAATTKAIEQVQRIIDKIEKDKHPDIRELKDAIASLDKLQNMIIVTDDRAKETATEQEGLSYIVPSEDSKEEATSWVE